MGIVKSGDIIPIYKTIGIMSPEHTGETPLVDLLQRDVLMGGEGSPGQGRVVGLPRAGKGQDRIEPGIPE